MLPNFDRAYIKGIISKITKIYGPQWYEQRNGVHDIIKRLHLMPLQPLQKKKEEEWQGWQMRHAGWEQMHAIFWLENLLRNNHHTVSCKNRWWKINWVGSARYPMEFFHEHNKEYFNQMNNYNLLGEHSYFWTKAGCHLCIQDVHMTCNIELMGISHIVSLIVSLSMTAAMCTTATTGNFELMESSKIATVAVHVAWLRRWQGRMV